MASGASLVGPVGGVVRQEFTVHGDRVVLAARLMQLAAKLGGMVLCDEETHDATRDDIRFVRRTPHPPEPCLHAHPDRTLTRAAHKLYP